MAVPKRKIRKNKIYNSEEKKENPIWDALILLGLLFTLVVILIPIILIAKYSFMSADDFSYMYQVGGIWKASHSVFKTLIFEAKQSIETWKTWQGLYFADWLYFVVLTFFGEKAYFMGTYISVASIVVSNLLFAIFVFRKTQGADLTKSIIAILPVMMLQLLLPTSGMEAYFWMISAILYTFSFSMMITLLALVIYLFNYDGSKGDLDILKISCFLLAFALGGSNYVTGLPMIPILLILCVFSYIFKKRNSGWLLLILLVYIGCFLLNVLSPGAGVRQASAGAGDSAVHAILMSFVEALKYIKMWTNLPIILVNLALIPLFWDMNKKRKISFKLPILVTVFSFCTFASMFTPNLYALKIIGMYRVQNMYRFALFLMLPMNVWYWIGFLRIKYEKHLEKKVKEKIKINSIVLGILKVAFAGAATVLIALTIYKYYGRTSTSVSAYFSLRENEAQIYYSEWEERLEVYKDDSIKDPVFETYSRKPYLLYFVDISADNTDWVNEAYARYFRKNTVNLKTE